MTSSLYDEFTANFNAIKPPLPYTVGKEFALHVLRPALPDYSVRILPNSVRQRELRNTQHPVETCRAYPPAPGIHVNSLHAIRVKVKGQIRVKDDAGAQLVVVEVCSDAPNIDTRRPPQTGAEYVTKFYDPLYNQTQDDADPFVLADRNYQLEATAHEHLHELWGSYIPSFYGSYTTSIETLFDRKMLGTAQNKPGFLCSGNVIRSVRCILIQRILGKTMADIPYPMSEQQSQAIMKGVVDAESQLWARDVSHRDVFPRNVMIVDSGKGQLNVLLIDLGSAVIGRLCDEPYLTDGKRQQMLPGTYISPLLRWHPCKLGGKHGPLAFTPWISWEWHPWLEKTYQAENSSITSQMRDHYLSSFSLQRYEQFSESKGEARSWKVAKKKSSLGEAALEEVVWAETALEDNDWEDVRTKGANLGKRKRRRPISKRATCKSFGRSHVARG